MFPIRDHNPSQQTPFVTYALIIVNVGIFLSYWHLFNDQRALNQFYYDWAILPARIADGGSYGTLVSSMFLHGGFMHLAGNMLFLWIFGDNMEEEMGHFGFALFYLASGIGAGLVHVVSAPSSIVPTIGASGAIAGVMGGYLLLFPKAKVDILVIFIIIFRIFPVPAWIMLGAWFGLQLLNGTTTDLSGGGVAYWAHAGGFIIGLVLTLPIWLRRGGVSFWDRTEGHPPHPDATYNLSPSSIPIVRRRK